MRIANLSLTRFVSNTLLAGGVLCFSAISIHAEDDPPNPERDRSSSREHRPEHPEGPPHHPSFGPPAFFQKLDADGDGRLSAEELENAGDILGKLDANDDGLDPAELMGFSRGERSAGFRPQRPESDRPEGERPRPNRDRPNRDPPNRDRPEGDRPEGDRPQRERSQGDRPDGDRRSGSRPGPGGPPWMRDRDVERPPRGEGEDDSESSPRGPRSTERHGPGFGRPPFMPGAGRGPQVIIVHVYHHGEGGLGSHGPHAHARPEGPPSHHREHGMGPRGRGRGDSEARRPGPPQHRDGEQRDHKDHDQKDHDHKDKSPEGKKASLEEQLEQELETMISYFTRQS